MADNKKIVTRIDGKWMTDVSSFHVMSPDASTFDISIGNPKSKYSTHETIALPSDVMLKTTAKALTYMGMMNGGIESSTALTPDAVIGDTYVVSLSGFINGTKVENGDTLICIADTSAATAGTVQTVNANWNYVQRNFDFRGISKEGHIHKVEYSDYTELGGVLTPKGTVSTPSIKSNMTTNSISYLSNGTCSISKSKVTMATPANNYQISNEDLTLTFATLSYNKTTAVTFNPTLTDFTAITDASPALASTPVFTGQVLDKHRHAYTKIVDTSIDIDPVD